MNASRSPVILSVLMITCTLWADPTVLHSPRRSGSDYTFTLEGEFNASYVIEHSTNLVDWSAVSTNRDSAAIRNIHYADWWYRTHFFRAYRLREALFSYAILARDSVDFSYTTGVTVDSFDSANPLSSSNGHYDQAKRNDKGNISANSFPAGNAEIMGSASVGLGEVSLGPNGSIGSKAWVEAGNRGIQPGHLVRDTEWHPILVVPPFTNAPSPHGGTLDGVAYTYLLDGGNFLLPTLDLSGTNRMRVTIDSVLFVAGDVHLFGNGLIEIDPGATLKFYVGSGVASLGCNAIKNSGSPANFQYYGLRENDRLFFSPSRQGTNLFIGTIYAPDANVILNAGSGLDLCSFSGSIVGQRVVAYGPCNIHFDGNLLRDGPQR